MVPLLLAAIALYKAWMSACHWATFGRRTSRS